jgi:hypothetical protein
MLRCDRCGFNKKRTGSCYAELVLLRPMGSAGHVGHKTVMHYFSCSIGSRTDSIKSMSGHITTNLCFASDEICGSCSAFRCVRGTKRCHTIFLAPVGPVRIGQKVC